MNSLETITQFFGWCTAINVIVLLLATIFLTAMRDWVAGIHTSMLGVSREQISEAYVQYLSNFKIAVLLLNFTPWLALKLMA
jgi:hypothetical protein